MWYFMLPVSSASCYRAAASGAGGGWGFSCSITQRSGGVSFLANHILARSNRLATRRWRNQRLVALIEVDVVVIIVSIPMRYSGPAGK